MRNLPAAIERHHHTHRATQPGHAAAMALDRAQHLICLVRDQGPDTTGPYLDRLTQDQMYALVITLAAMVPDDQSPEQLLAWTQPFSGQVLRNRERARSARRRNTQPAHQEEGTAA